jgi:hypothetical protein
MLIYRKNTDAPVGDLADEQIRLDDSNEAKRNFERHPLK